MLGVDLPLRTRGGAVERLTDAGRAGHLGLPRVADELYRSARRLRVFVSSPPSRALEPVRGAPHLAGRPRWSAACERERLSFLPEDGYAEPTCIHGAGRRQWWREDWPGSD